VAGIVGYRFLDAMRASQQREVTIAASLASLVLVTPAMNPDVARLARGVLARTVTENGGHPAGGSAPPGPQQAPARRRLLRRRG
jgi:hypothetical protein